MNLTDQQLVMSNLTRELRQLILRAELALQQIRPAAPASLTEAQNKQVSSIMAVVEQRFGVTEHLVMSRCREKHVVDARHAAIWLMARCMGLENLRIGRIFKIDSGTVIHAVRRVNDLMKNEPAFKESVSQAQKDLE